MKIKKKLRVINNNKNIKNKIGFIFISQNQNKNKNNNKKIKINLTNLYYLNNDAYFELLNFKNTSIDDILISHYNLNIKNDIIENINIYDKNIKLYLVILKYDTNLHNFKKKNFIDLYHKYTNSIYNDTYNYNKKILNSYLNLNLKDINNILNIKLLNIYYFLIGYI